MRPDDDYSNSQASSWFIGIIVALALLAIAYLVFSVQAPPPAACQIDGVCEVSNAPSR